MTSWPAWAAMAGGHNRRGPQGVSVTPDAIGMWSETTTHGRVWREMPRAPCPPRHPSVRPACSHSLPVERLLPGPLRHPSLPGVSLFRHFRCYLGRASGAAERQRVCGANEQQRRPAEACQSPRARTPLNGLTKKCSSEHRPGPGFRTAKSERPLRAQGPGDMPRIKSPHQRTGAVAGLCSGKVGKRLPEGPHERRGGAAARCRRHRSSGDARRRHRRSRLAPERGCHEVTGLRRRACAASAGARGYAPYKKSASADRRGHGTLPRQSRKAT